MVLSHSTAALLCLGDVPRSILSGDGGGGLYSVLCVFVFFPPEMICFWQLVMLPAYFVLEAVFCVRPVNGPFCRFAPAFPPPPLPRVTPTAPDVTQCLGLSLLSSIANTLGPASPGGVDGGERGNGGGGGGGVAASLGCLSEDERVVKELQGAQVITTGTSFPVY